MFGYRVAESQVPARPEEALMEKLFWRSGPESNRHPRICSPMHHHSATGPPMQDALYVLRRAQGQALRLARPRASNLPLARHIGAKRTIICVFSFVYGPRPHIPS
jgi:hypothetical protein